MNYSSKYLEAGVDALASLPGIGRKTALRLALYLLKQDKTFTDHLANAVTKMRNNIRECKVCFNLADDELCEICADKKRNHATVCIVESIRDVMAIEATGHYRGSYHVLGGVISPIDGIGPGDLKIDQLLERIENQAIEELIMAVSPTIEGETTIFYIAKKLRHTKIKISTIARGVSFGGELQYTDEITLGRSIVARLPYAVDRED